MSFEDTLPGATLSLRKQQRVDAGFDRTDGTWLNGIEIKTIVEGVERYCDTMLYKNPVFIDHHSTVEERNDPKATKRLIALGVLGRLEFNERSSRFIGLSVTETKGDKDCLVIRTFPMPEYDSPGTASLLTLPGVATLVEGLMAIITA